MNLVGIFTFIKAIPELLAVAKEVLSFLHELSDYAERYQRTKELREALEKARKDKDTTSLEDIFKNSKSPPPRSV